MISTDTQSIIEDMTDDPWEWYKFWTECNEDGTPYTPQVSEES